MNEKNYNAESANTEYELVYIPLLNLRIKTINNELKELNPKIKLGNVDNKISQRYLYLTQKRMEYTDELKKRDFNYGNLQ